MKKNETNATEVMKFFREQREAKQLKAMNYGGMIDPPNEVTKPKSNIIIKNGHIYDGPNGGTTVYKSDGIKPKSNQAIQEEGRGKISQPFK